MDGCLEILIDMMAEAIELADSEEYNQRADYLQGRIDTCEYLLTQIFMLSEAEVEKRLLQEIHA
jgi:hypothetical protein